MKQAILWERKAVNYVTKSFRPSSLEGSHNKVEFKSDESTLTISTAVECSSSQDGSVGSAPSFGDKFKAEEKDENEDEEEDEEYCMPARIVQILNNSFTVLNFGEELNETAAHDSIVLEMEDEDTDDDVDDDDDDTSCSSGCNSTSCDPKDDAGSAHCRTITQNDFFQECLLQKTGGCFVVHFYSETEQSQKLDRRLAELAKDHHFKQVNFRRIQGLLAPFVAPRLGVLKFPGLVAIKCGQVLDKQCDFESLGLLEGDDQWDEEFLRLWMAKNTQ
jgi:hypothetical protein